MKRLFISIFVLLCIAAGSCKKASDPADGPSVQLNNNLDSTVAFSAVINGANWTTDSAYGYIVRSSGNDSTLSGLLITATRMANGTASTIVFNIDNYTGPNTYTINPPNNEVIYYIGTSRHFATSGQVIIATDTAFALRGTFTFVSDTFVITKGVFNVAKP